jgi:hypothetical protein
MFKILFYLAILFLILSYIVFAPFMFIWSLNTLFKLNVEYNFYTWIAVYTLLILLDLSKGLIKK